MGYVESSLTSSSFFAVESEKVSRCDLISTTTSQCILENYGGMQNCPEGTDWKILKKCCPGGSCVSRSISVAVTTILTLVSESLKWISATFSTFKHVSRPVAKVAASASVGMVRVVRDLKKKLIMASARHCPSENLIHFSGQNLKYVLNVTSKYLYSPEYGPYVRRPSSVRKEVVDQQPQQHSNIAFWHQNNARVSLKHIHATVSVFVARLDGNTSRGSRMRPVLLRQARDDTSGQTVERNILSYPCFKLTRPLSPAVSSKSTLHHTACAHQISDIPTNDECTPMTLYRNRGSYFRASANFGSPALEGFSATKTREKQKLKDSGTLTG